MKTRIDELIRASAALALCVVAAGCATLETALENRVLCSLDRKQMAFISWYGPLGVGAKIAPADAVLCGSKP